MKSRRGTRASTDTQNNAALCWGHKQKACDSSQGGNLQFFKAIGSGFASVDHGCSVKALLSETWALL